MPLVDVKVPNIGDFENVPIIEILVKAGDDVNAEDPLITVESDKASMDVPSPARGRISEILISVGDRVSAGSAILRLDTTNEGKAETTRARKISSVTNATAKATYPADCGSGPEHSEATELRPPADFDLVFASPFSPARRQRAGCRSDEN